MNAQCYYVPSRVKTDLERSCREEVAKGKSKINMKEFYGLPYTTLSYLCRATNEADARAFRQLMRHIRKVDEQEHIVMLVHVENEPGLQGAAREHSDAADAVFGADIPQPFVDYMRSLTANMAADIREVVEHGAK